MATLDEYSTALHTFCTDLAGFVDRSVNEDRFDDIEDVLGGVRETIANLMLIEYECERALHHA